MELNKAKELFGELDRLTYRVERLSALNYFTQRGVLAEISEHDPDKTMQERIRGVIYELEIISDSLLEDFATYQDKYRAAMDATEGSTDFCERL